MGVFKKFLIADYLAENLVNRVFDTPGLYTGMETLIGVWAYAFQLYYDFSGYTDLAIGSAMLLGIKLPENFNRPYTARNISDFWRRWHITLSNWLRDYLYFSLPGLRGSRWKRYRNAAITALLGGLWHGASWTFVCWGAMHGAAVGMNHWWIARRQRLGRAPSDSAVVRVCCWVTMYVFICVTWVLFRAQSFRAAGIVLRKMSGLAPGGIVWFYSPLAMVLPLVIGAHLIGVLAPCRSNRISGPYVLLPGGFRGAFLATAWLLALVLFGATKASPFIYFQF